MEYTHFLTRRLVHVGAEMSLNVLAYNFKRVLSILGFEAMMRAMRLVGALALFCHLRLYTGSVQLYRPAKTASVDLFTEKSLPRLQ
jgi:hypothetical protein